jgi:NADH:ubiquinone oxidoreductase subunit D
MGEVPSRNFTINFGLQHPAAHGVLRLVLELDCEGCPHGECHKVAVCYLKSCSHVSG